MKNDILKLIEEHAKKVKKEYKNHWEATVYHSLSREKKQEIYNKGGKNAEYYRQLWRENADPQNIKLNDIYMTYKKIRDEMELENFFIDRFN